MAKPTLEPTLEECEDLDDASRYEVVRCEANGSIVVVVVRERPGESGGPVPSVPT